MVAENNFNNPEFTQDLDQTRQQIQDFLERNEEEFEF
jgi:hypothetical protein